jgi:hypothetical protein
MKGCGSISRNIPIILLTVILCGCASSPAATPTTQLEIPEVSQETTWWTPGPGLSWQIQYVGEIDLDLDVDVFNLDLFETSEADIQYLHAKGIKVICYINAGAWEDWRPDSDDFPESILGEDYEGWPGERWLDIRQIDLLVSIMTARMDLCAEKGFDGVDPDNLDGYQNATGFDLTPEDQLAYNSWLAAEAHRRGLGIGLKNDPEQASEMAAYFDWVTVESCFDEGWCELLMLFIQEGKPIFAIEYTEKDITLDDFCSQAAGLSIDALLKHRQLDAWREACP